MGVSDARINKAKSSTALYCGILGSIAVMLLVVFGAGSGCSTSPEIRLRGAGATFPNPIYRKWFSWYSAAHPNVKFDYEAIGSHDGQAQIIARTVDFAGSDAPLKDKDAANAPGEDRKSVV